MCFCDKVLNLYTFQASFFKQEQGCVGKPGQCFKEDNLECPAGSYGTCGYKGAEFEVPIGAPCQMAVDIGEEVDRMNTVRQKKSNFTKNIDFYTLHFFM